jgi:hypothetical protein
MISYGISKHETFYFPQEEGLMSMLKMMVQMIVVKPPSYLYRNTLLFRGEGVDRLYNIVT